MDDGKAYTAWLTQLTQQPWRLPTKAEWEKAARWDGSHSRIYPWGDEFIPGYCYCGWYVTISGERMVVPPNAPVLDQYGRLPLPPSIKPVGMYPDGASPYGVEDMAGNVSEIAINMFSAKIRDDGSLIVNEMRTAMGRGGHCDCGPAEMRAARRHPDYLSSDYIYKYVGFRMVRTPLAPFIQCSMRQYR